MSLDDRFEEYCEKYPLLQELCERNILEVEDEVAYLIALYGMALGYLSNKHPATAFGEYALACCIGLGDISAEGWEQIQMQIANKLEERANEG